MNQPFLFDEYFFKSFTLEDNGLLKALSHKYLRKEGNRYIYKEKDMDQETFHRFMQDQITAMKQYREAIAKKIGTDPGEGIYHKWIKLFSKKFREVWMRNHGLMQPIMQY